ncbi:MAG: hypothetical protein ACXVAY_03775 [Mucilaginibacter sp.]
MKWFPNFLLVAVIASFVNIVIALVFLKSPLREALTVSISSGICLGIVLAIYLPYHAKKNRI